MRSMFVNKSLPETLMVEDEVLDWHALSPAKRFLESQKLWEVFVLPGGNSKASTARRR